MCIEFIWSYHILHSPSLAKPPQNDHRTNFCIFSWKFLHWCQYGCLGRADSSILAKMEAPLAKINALAHGIFKASNVITWEVMANTIWPFLHTWAGRSSLHCHTKITPHTSIKPNAFSYFSWGIPILQPKIFLNALGLLETEHKT